MSVKAWRQELPNKGVKLTALRAAAYAQNVRPSKHVTYDVIRPCPEFGKSVCFTGIIRVMSGTAD